MALDGITVAALTAELNQTILNGRISKIAQPEADELLLTIKAPSVPVPAFFKCQCFPALSLSYSSE